MSLKLARTSTTCEVKKKGGERNVLSLTFKPGALSDDTVVNAQRLGNGPWLKLTLEILGVELVLHFDS